MFTSLKKKTNSRRSSNSSSEEHQNEKKIDMNKTPDTTDQQQKQINATTFSQPTSSIHWSFVLALVNIFEDFRNRQNSLTHALTSVLDDIRKQVQSLQGDVTSLSNEVDIFESGLQI